MDEGEDEEETKEQPGPGSSERGDGMIKNGVIDDSDED